MTSFSVTRRKIYSAARERRDNHAEPAAPPSKTTRRFLPRHRTHLLPLLAHSLPAIFTRGVVFRLSDQLNTRAIWTDAIELMNSRPTVAHRRRCGCVIDAQPLQQSYSYINTSAQCNRRMWAKASAHALRAYAIIKVSLRSKAATTAFRSANKFDGQLAD